MSITGLMYYLINPTTGNHFIDLFRLLLTSITCNSHVLVQLRKVLLFPERIQRIGLVRKGLEHIILNMTHIFNNQSLLLPVYNF